MKQRCLSRTVTFDNQARTGAAERDCAGSQQAERWRDCRALDTAGLMLFMGATEAAHDAHQNVLMPTRLARTGRVKGRVRKSSQPA